MNATLDKEGKGKGIPSEVIKPIKIAQPIAIADPSLELNRMQHENEELKTKLEQVEQ